MLWLATNDWISCSFLLFMASRSACFSFASLSLCLSRASWILAWMSSLRRSICAYACLRSDSLCLSFNLSSPISSSLAWILIFVSSAYFSAFNSYSRTCSSRLLTCSFFLFNSSRVSFHSLSPEMTIYDSLFSVYSALRLYFKFSSAVSFKAAIILLNWSSLFLAYFFSSLIYCVINCTFCRRTACCLACSWQHKWASTLASAVLVFGCW